MASSTATKVTKGAARAAAAAASVSGSTIASWTQRLTAYATSGYEAVYKSQACQASIPECPFVLDYGKSKLVKASVYVDGQLKGLSTWQIILVAIVFWTIFIKLKNFLFADEPLLVRLKGSFFFYMKKIPYVRAKIDEEIGKGLTGMCGRSLRLLLLPSTTSISPSMPSPVSSSWLTPVPGIAV
eukprot:TRINITY_DN10485_c0_g1_i1.p1 TRINITY_DN10485_c0_g1~~TRINITY_DN10485_c0_g1_i1.p1  ORF type:complete len:184 (-),score=40.87 TRINITY_DN10485_c0_g1_i1:16-567(-)